MVSFYEAIWLLGTDGFLRLVAISFIEWSLLPFLARVSFLYNLFFIIFDNRIDETI